MSGFRLNIFLFNFLLLKASGLSLYFAPLVIVVVVLSSSLSSVLSNLSCKFLC